MLHLPYAVHIFMDGMCLIRLGSSTWELDGSAQMFMTLHSSETKMSDTVPGICRSLSVRWHILGCPYHHWDHVGLYFPHSLSLLLQLLEFLQLLPDVAITCHYYIYHHCCLLVLIYCLLQDITMFYVTEHLNMEEKKGIQCFRIVYLYIVYFMLHTAV